MAVLDDRQPAVPGILDDSSRTFVALVLARTGLIDDGGAVIAPGRPAGNLLPEMTAGPRPALLQPGTCRRIIEPPEKGTRVYPIAQADPFRRIGSLS